MSLTASEVDLLLESGEESAPRPSAVRPLWPIGALVGLLGLVAAATVWGGHPKGALLDELIIEAETSSCPQSGENCHEFGCCADASLTCFKKDIHWASCNATCDSYVEWNHDTQQFETKEHKVWDCEEVKPPCTDNGKNCHASQCCNEPGMTCFKKNEHWASCNATCDENTFWNHDTKQFEKQEEKLWDCTALSQPAPTCTNNGDDCSETKCCKEAGETCFRKDDHWSSCNVTCDSHMKWDHEANQWEKQDDKQWDCTVLSSDDSGNSDGNSGEGDGEGAAGNSGDGNSGEGNSGEGDSGEGDGEGAAGNSDGNSGEGDGDGDSDGNSGEESGGPTA